MGEASTRARNAARSGHDVAIIALALRLECEPSLEGIASYYRRVGLPAPSELALSAGLRLTLDAARAWARRCAPNAD